MSLCRACKHYTQDLLNVIERQVVKCYLECHLAHKDGSKNVVGDGEKHSFLDQQREREKNSQSERGVGAIRDTKTILNALFR